MPQQAARLKSLWTSRALASLSRKIHIGLDDLHSSIKTKMLWVQAACHSKGKEGIDTVELGLSNVRARYRLETPQETSVDKRVS